MPQAQKRPGTESGEASGSKTADLAGQAQEKAQQAADQAQEKAQQAAGRMQDRLREQVDQRSSQAAEQINEQASDLRSVGQTLREQGKDGPAKVADRLAEQAEKVGRYLSDRDSDALLADAEDFGRKQPLAVAAGGLALGFAASRFLKASSSERYRSRPSYRRDSSSSGAGEAGVQDSPTPYAGQGSIMPGAAPGVL